MFIRNYTNSDLSLNVNTNHITLIANDVTTVPDGLITLAELQKMFGLASIGVEESGPSTSIMNNQQELETGKLYLTCANLGSNVRLFIGVDGKVDVYGSDSKTIPTTFDEMSCPECNEAVTGINALEIIPRYIAFKANEGTPEIIVTNCNCYEVGNLT